MPKYPYCGFEDEFRLLKAWKRNCLGLRLGGGYGFGSP